MSKRRLLREALTAEEIATLEELARQHPYGDFRLRGLGLLALDAGRGVAEICEILRISANRYTTGPRRGVSKG